MKKIDLAGKTFGRLIVIEEAGVDTRGEKFWLCNCECGGKTKVLSSNLRTGHTKSCGCMKYEGSNTKHGMAGTPEHNIWQAMLQRCYNKNNSEYHNYGGRGITVCDRWLISFSNFYKDVGDCPKGYFLQRIDINKGYFPENCRWATKKELVTNVRRNIMIKMNGKTQCLKDWCDELNLNYVTMRSRIKVWKWDGIKTLTTPIKTKENYISKKKEKNETDKILSSIRRAVYKQLKKGKGGKRTFGLLGYTPKQLKEYLETKFQEGMSWDNYGKNGWHLDHIVPRSVFNIKTASDIDFKKCWALENLQPLWAKDNLSKGRKLQKPFQPSLNINV
jgi:hypothetical protein